MISKEFSSKSIINDFNAMKGDTSWEFYCVYLAPLGINFWLCHCLVLWLGPWGIGACLLNQGVDGVWGRGSANVLCDSACASVHVIINKYGCVLCVSWLVQLMIIKNVINNSFLDLDLSYTTYIFLCCTIYWLFFFFC